MCLESLQNQKRDSEATLAMRVLRGSSYNPSEELAEMQREAEQAASRKSSVFDLIRTSAARKALLVLLCSMLFQQLSGINGVIFYTVSIFKASGSSMPADLASVIVALVQVRSLTLTCSDTNTFIYYPRQGKFCLFERIPKFR